MRYYNTVKILMKLINEAEITLTLSVRIIIRKKDKHKASMLNLIFIS